MQFSAQTCIDLTLLIKSQVRLRRGVWHKILVSGQNTKRPSDFKSFLSNDDNKRQLINMLLDVWTQDRFADKLRGRRIILICEGKPFCFNQMMYVEQLQKLL